MARIHQGSDKNDLIAGRYKLFDVIWETGASYLYRADDIKLNRPVTVRQYKQYQADEAMYFKTETEMLSRFSHTNIVPLLDMVEDLPSPITIFPPLSALEMRQFSEWDIISILKFFERIADAVDFLHSKKILHRVISPLCIMTDERQNPYLINFALAVDYEWLAEQGKINYVAGIPQYLSPEAIRGESITPLSDIYSFGMVLYQALAGQVAFQGQGRRELYQAHLEDPIPSIAFARPDLSRLTIQAIDNLFVKLLSKDPADRYQNAMSAINDLYDLVYRGEYSPKSPFEGRLFISYSRHDEAYVSILAKELKQYDVEFWYDKNLEVGSTWDEAINQQLQICDAIMIVATPQAMDSAFVTYEWSYFIGAGKPVLPFILHDVGKPEEFLHPVLARIQGVRSTDDVSEDVRKIIGVLKNLLAKNVESTL